jgi:hypothetical protein
VRLGHDPVANCRIQPEPYGRAQQRAGVVAGQAAYFQLGKSRKLAARLTCREDDPDALCQEAMGDEREGQRRGPVQPLRVVDQAEDRSLISSL